MRSIHNAEETGGEKWRKEKGSPEKKKKHNGRSPLLQNILLSKIGFNSPIKTYVMAE